MQPKQNVTLLEICRLPDVQLHSKTSFLKALVNKQSLNIAKMRENIARLSYTVKTIGVQGDQVGIISKRLPLKFKGVEKLERCQQFVNPVSYLPHRSFYSQKLIAIRKQKEEKPVQPLKLNLYDLNRQETIRSHRTERKIKTRAKSMANLCKSGSRTKINDEQLDSSANKFRRLTSHNIIVHCERK